MPQADHSIIPCPKLGEPQKKFVIMYFPFPYSQIDLKPGHTLNPAQP